MLLAVVNGSNWLYVVFEQCIKVLNNQFYICGIKISLMAFIIFDVVATLVLAVIFRLFR